MGWHRLRKRASGRERVATIDGTCNRYRARGCFAADSPDDLLALREHLKTR